YPSPYSYHLHPPPSTHSLFPYTSLFRSRRRWDNLQQRLNLCFVISRDADVAVVAQALQVFLAFLFDDLFGHRTAHLVFVERRRIDRKSTRLNSSHVSISYAVFCLKKQIIHHCHRPAAEIYKAPTIIILPSMPSPTPRGLPSTGDSSMNAPWTAFRTPTLSVPLPVV